MDLSNKKPLIAVVGVLGLAVIAWLAFGFFGIQSAFLDTEVNESADDLFTAAPADENEDDVDEAQTETTIAESDEVAPDPDPDEPSTESENEVIDEPVDEVDENAAEDPGEEIDEGPVEEAVEDAPDEIEVEADVAAPGEVVSIASGAFQGVNDYSVSGNLTVLNDGSEQRFLRFEDFVSDNGPDLKVYLRAANGDFVSLGDLSGNIGDQNYEIPVDVDLETFNTVEIWCERFSAGFGTATLA